MTLMQENVKINENPARQVQRVADDSKAQQLHVAEELSQEKLRIEEEKR